MNAKEFATKHAGKMAESGSFSGRIVGHYNGSVIIEDVTFNPMDAHACALFGAVVADALHGNLASVGAVRLVDDAPKPAQVVVDPIRKTFAIDPPPSPVLPAPLAGLEDAAERAFKAMCEVTPYLSRESPTTQRWWAGEVRELGKKIRGGK